MKKLLIAALCTSAFTLTACDKKATESTDKKEAATATAAANLSSNNAADIKADLAAIEAWTAKQATEATEFQAKITEATQKSGQNSLKEAFEIMKSQNEKSVKDLDALTIKSTEVDALRSKMKESANIGLEMAEAAMSTQPDAKKISELTTKATEVTKAMAEDLKTLQAKAAEAK
ncbi:hypothetical protein EC844_12313 [Acinetobacter calcoaceticus]|uniref:Lipoprotein n=1 Tax=Acinetobacter calcoaceticus TaxID=471 RepID=A0A4R1XHW9_ACICA|nr:hypothetical protein EC844_12313 [Acinetobacter calcoaceticus]